MRIEKIELKDFRGFPAPQIYTYNLANGKNLLLYGENGSGKSSLYRALFEFFNFGPTGKPFRLFRNVFSSPPNVSNIDGYVALQFDDGVRCEWRFLGQRPIVDPGVAKQTREALVDAARRASLLEYRSLLATFYPFDNIPQRLFKLAVETLLANVPVNLPGRAETTVSQLWNGLLSSRPKRNYRRHLAVVATAVTAFNSGFNAILPDVQTKASAFLEHFAGTDLELTFEPVAVRYENSLHDVVARRLNFQVKLRGIAIPEWNEFLNEARLSALALCLYLAGATLGNPTPPASAGAPLKLLVLDDVLIGLDLANRLPVLRLVEKEFIDKGWQVLLLTFDRAWYEVAKQQLRGELWSRYELFIAQAGNHEQPLLVPDEEHLYRALEFLEMGQVKAASVHVRTAFENLLKYACQQLGVAVKYHSDVRKVPASDLWSALKSHRYNVTPARQCLIDDKGKITWWRPKSQQKSAISGPLRQRVEHAVSWVLNPLSHSQTVDRYRLEIEDAIYVIDDLEREIRHAISVPSMRLTEGTEEILALLRAHVRRMERLAQRATLKAGGNSMTEKAGGIQ